MASAAVMEFSLKPRIFIASASEAKSFASALREHLEHSAEVTLWTEDVFGPSELTLESLLDIVDHAQFGVFVLTGEDLSIIRGTETRTPRDNVLFELGLFMGRLGKDRCFLVTPNDSTVHLPTDFAGLTTVSFDARRSKDNILAATGSAAARILRAIAKKSAACRPKALETASDIIQVAARLIALRANLDEHQVRAFLHLYDAAERCLVPAAKFIGISRFADAGIHIPCTEGSDWFIVSRSFRENRLTCDEVDWTVDLNTVPAGKWVWGDLRSVVAQPVRPEDREIPPIGVVAFDSSMGLDSLGWKNDKALRDIMSLLAGTLFTVVSRIY